MLPRSTFLKTPLVFLLSAAGLGCGGGDAATEAEQEAREEAFRQSMSGVVLEGFFTVGDGAKLREERYEIAKVSKLGGDIWVFQARIQYGSRRRHGAGAGANGMGGRYAGPEPDRGRHPRTGHLTARVLFYDDQYVGVWRHGEVGGLHFGRIAPGPNSE